MITSLNDQELIEIRWSSNLVKFYRLLIRDNFISITSNEKSRDGDILNNCITWPVDWLNVFLQAFCFVEDFLSLEFHLLQFGEKFFIRLLTLLSNWLVLFQEDVVCFIAFGSHFSDCVDGRAAFLFLFCVSWSCSPRRILLQNKLTSIASFQFDLSDALFSLD